MTGYPLRALAGVGVVVLLALVAAAQFHQQMTGFSRDNPDTFKIAQQGERYAGVAAMVPPDAIVGYLTDGGPRHSAAEAEFFGVQYAIAPRMLVADSTRSTVRWVVSNFHRRPDTAAIERRHGLRLVRNFGVGVMLFEKVR